MLKDYVKNYSDYADAVIGKEWRNMGRSDLCFSCCEFEDKDKSLYNAYLCALVVRYWHLIRSNVVQGSGAYDENDCYNWLIDSILGTIHAKSWLNPESSLYNDPLAPDKSINVRMKSHRQGFYQWSNCQKRSGDFSINSSYESLFEDCGDAAFPIDDTTQNTIDYNMSVNDLIRKEFSNKNYMGSFTIYGIINADVFDYIKEGKDRYTKFNKKKLSSYVRHLDDDFCREFSDTIDLPVEDVKKAVDCCKSLSRIRVYTIIDNTINGLSKKLST